MDLERNVLGKYRPALTELEGYGFIKNEDGYHYAAELMDGDLRAEIVVGMDGGVTGTVTDLMTGEEYLPLRIVSQTGSYVSMARYEYQELLRDIAEHCFVPMPFVSDQANRLTAAICDRYGDRPDFPWTETMHNDSGVFRNPENRKWYGLIMRIDRRKIAPDQEPGQVDIINLKIDPAQREKLLAEVGIYPAWHMNHRNWITVPLDDTVTDGRLLELVEVSHRFTENAAAKGRRSSSRRPGSGPGAGTGAGTGADSNSRSERLQKHWIVPANPKFYDIVSVFDVEEETHWKQGKGIERGDIVFFYVGVPWSAILYKAVVTKTHIPYSRTGDGRVNLRELMHVRILKRYDKTAFTLRGALAQFGVRTVRGPRFMPEDLEKYMDGHAEKSCEEP